MKSGIFVKTRERLFCIKIKSPDILLHIYHIWPIHHEVTYKQIFLWSMLTFVWCVLISRLGWNSVRRDSLQCCRNFHDDPNLKNHVGIQSFSHCMKNGQIRTFFGPYLDIFHALSVSHLSLIRVITKHWANTSRNGWRFLVLVSKNSQLSADLLKFRKDIFSKTSFPEQEHKVQWH